MGSIFDGSGPLRQSTATKKPYDPWSEDAVESGVHDRLGSFPRWVALASLLVQVGAGCGEKTPTSVLLEISATASVGPLDTLRLDAYSSWGLALGSYRLPAEGSPVLPSETVLYPPSSGELRLRVLGLRAAVTVAEGATRVTTEAGKQVRAQIVLGSGRLPDRDGDGVPDELDNCPDLPNPLQGPCGGDDGGIDAGDGPRPDLSDGPAVDSDGLLDATPDVATDLGPDGPKTCSTATQCDDGNACTKDSCVANFCVWTPLSCSGPNKVCHRWATCDPQLGCFEEPVADKTTCNDNLYCTVNDECTAGKCDGAPRDCTSGAAVCQVASCNDATDKCVYTNAPTGTACDDGDACTQDDRCVSVASGVNCLAPPIAPVTLEANNMFPRGDRPVVVDAAGVVHAIYSVSNQLRYAHDTGGTWSLSTLDSGTNVGRYPSLTMDSAGKLRAVYEANGTLRVATFDRGGGPVVTENAGPTDGHVSATIDAGSVLHVTHRRGDDLYYSRRSAGVSGSWTHTLVHAPTQTVVNPSLALDGSGFVHIAYGVGTIQNPTTWFSSELHHASNESGAWAHTQLPPFTGVQGNFASLVITSNGTLLVAHAALLPSLSHSDLLLATRNPTTKAWSSTVIVAGGKVGSYCSIVVGASDHLHVLYRDFGSNELRTLTNATGSWSTPLLLDQGSLMGRWAAFARAPSGRLHAVYEQQGASKVRYVNWSSCQ